MSGLLHDAAVILLAILLVGGFMCFVGGLLELNWRRKSAKVYKINERR